MQEFLQKINLKNQQFKCYKAGDESEALALTVDIHNLINAGADKSDIAKLKKFIPERNEEIVNFYQQMNGVSLYCNGEISGVEIYPVADLKALNEEWREWLEDYEDDEMCDYQRFGFAFGEVPRSGNYFVLYEGKVFYAEHDDFVEEPLAESFDEFLLKVVNNPPGFLYEMGCYARFSDGETDGQWIPKEFVSDPIGVN